MTEGTETVEVETNLTGEAMRCGRCGDPIEDGEQFCGRRLDRIGSMWMVDEVHPHCAVADGYRLDYTKADGGSTDGADRD